MSQSRDLLNDLLLKPQRETAGSDTSTRFDYQKNWAFCEMIKRHMSGADYLAAFEFHDDTVFLEPSMAPQKVEFFQVKTTKDLKPRSLASLLRGSGGKSSILGKMYQNFSGICHAHSVQVILVSNVPFEFSSSQICANDIAEKQRKTIESKLLAEVPSFSPDKLSSMHFMVVGVSLEAMPSYLTGEVAALFRHTFGEHHGANIHSWIRLVQGEITRRNNCSSDGISSVDQLIDNKCISREFVDRTLSHYNSKSRRPPNAQMVLEELQAGGWSYADRVKLDRALSSAIADRSDPTNADVQSIAQKLIDRLNSGEFYQLTEFLTHVRDNVGHFAVGVGVYDDLYYVLGLAVVIFDEKI